MFRPNPPYKFVSVEGPVVGMQEADLERDINPLLYRYLGRNDGERYIHETYQVPEAPGELLIQVKPERW